MMTSSNGTIFRVTGPLCGEFTGPGEFPAPRPVTRSFDVFFDLRLNKWLSKQPWGWWFETPPWSLWCHCNDIIEGTKAAIISSRYISSCCHALKTCFSDPRCTYLLTHCGLVTLYGTMVFVNVGSDNVLVSWGHYLNQCWLVINWSDSLSMKFHSKFRHRIHGNIVENVICKKAFLDKSIILMTCGSIVPGILEVQPSFVNERSYCHNGYQLWAIITHWSHCERCGYLYISNHLTYHKYTSNILYNLHQNYILKCS